MALAQRELAPAPLPRPDLPLLEVLHSQLPVLECLTCTPLGLQGDKQTNVKGTLGQPHMYVRTCAQREFVVSRSVCPFSATPAQLEQPRAPERRRGPHTQLLSCGPWTGRGGEGWGGVGKGAVEVCSVQKEVWLVSEHLFDSRVEGEVPKWSPLPLQHLNGNHHTVQVGSGRGLWEGQHCQGVWLSQTKCTGSG